MFREVPRLVTTSDQTAERLVRDFGAPAGTDQRHHSRRSTTCRAAPVPAGPGATSCRSGR